MVWGSVQCPLGQQGVGVLKFGQIHSPKKSDSFE